MTEELAKIVFVAILTVGFFVWLWSLQKALALGRMRKEADWRIMPGEQPPIDVETGSRTVRGEPEQLSQTLARVFMGRAHDAAGPPFEITECTSKRIELKKLESLVSNQSGGTYFSHAEISFERLGSDTTRVSYTLSYDRLMRRTRRMALAIIFGVGLPLMAILGAVMWFTVIPSPVPAIRWQVLQTLQIAHGLWPPFLVMNIHNSGRRQSKVYFSNLLSTLEVAEKEHSR